MSKNHIRPLVNERNIKLEDFNEVLDYFLNGKPKGKIVYINDQLKFNFFKLNDFLTNDLSD